MCMYFFLETIPQSLELVENEIVTENCSESKSLSFKFFALQLNSDMHRTRGWSVVVVKLHCTHRTMFYEV